MTELDWVCPICGQDMRYKGGVIACDGLHGCMVNVRDMLQKAHRVDYKRFRLGDLQGYWEYVPHEHRAADKRKPAPGVVVGILPGRVAGWYIRAFRQCKPPRSVSRVGVQPPEHVLSEQPH